MIRRSRPRQRRRCGVIVICGPDGAGKSSLARALLEDLPGNDALLLHHRPGILPGRGDGEMPVTEPHRDPPYPRLLSSLKVLYIYLDYLLGWMARVRPALRQGRWVVVERGWLDLVVDPRRYRLRSQTLPLLLARLLPRPDLGVVLEAPTEVLLARKEELPAVELDRQMARWRELRPGDDTIRLAATSPPRVLLAQIRNRLAQSGPT